MAHDTTQSRELATAATLLHARRVEVETKITIRKRSTLPTQVELEHHARSSCVPSHWTNDPSPFEVDPTDDAHQH